MKRLLFTFAVFLAAGSPAAALAQQAVDSVALAPLALAEFVDSAALHQALAAAPPAPAGAPRRHLFWVRYDSTGALETVRAHVRAPSPGGYDSTMVALLRPHLRPQLARGRGAGEVLWLRPGSSPRISVLKSASEEQPRLTNMDALQSRMEAAAKRLVAGWPELAGREGTGVVGFTISDAGIPTGARYLSGPRSPEFQREIVAIVEAMRFRPALIEGVPVETRAELPITLTFRR